MCDEDAEITMTCWMIPSGIFFCRNYMQPPVTFCPVLSISFTALGVLFFPLFSFSSLLLFPAHLPEINAERCEFFLYQRGF
jgi:hypothetical protein